MTTRLPPISDSELKRLHDQLVAAGQILASPNYRLLNVSVRELVSKIQRENTDDPR